MNNQPAAYLELRIVAWLILIIVIGIFALLAGFAFGALTMPPTVIEFRTPHDEGVTLSEPAPYLEQYGREPPRNSAQDEPGHSP